MKEHFLKFWSEYGPYPDNPESMGWAVFLALVVFIHALLISWVLGRLLKRSQWVMGKLGRKVDQTVIGYVIKIKSLVVYCVALIVYVSFIPSLSGLFNTLLASAGITALVVGFAAKSTLSNIIAGFALAIYRPFRIGDKVEIHNHYGTIEDITLRHTIVKTWRQERLIIPNEQLDNMSLINYTIVSPEVLCTVEFGVSYDSDIDLVRSILLEEAEACPYILNKPDEPWVRLIELGDFSMVMRLYCWVMDRDQDWLTQFWMLEKVKKRFDREGVEIPFPYRTIVDKKDLPPPPKVADENTEQLRTLGAPVEKSAGGEAEEPEYLTPKRDDLLDQLFSWWHKPRP